MIFSIFQALTLQRSRTKADPAPDSASADQKPMTWSIPYLAEVTRRNAVMNSVVCPVRMAAISTFIAQKTRNGDIKKRAYFAVF